MYYDYVWSNNSACSIVAVSALNSRQLLVDRRHLVCIALSLRDPLHYAARARFGGLYASQIYRQGLKEPISLYSKT
jgi:hypothetical protein